MTGGLLVDKPEGWTSHDVVGRVRRLAGTRRVGHTGTLDPFATGVLVVCIGNATRLSQFIVGHEKEYVARVRLGWATDTQDRTGERTGEIALPERVPDDVDAIVRALEEGSGEQMQLPPMFSAKKVAGRALYKHARAGREVERAPVRVTARMTLEGDPASAVRRNDDGTVDVDVRVVCSAGTYVRTLAHDLGVRLGCGAHLDALRRTRVGRFRIEEASTLEELEGRVAERLVAPEALVAELPSVRLTEELVRRVLHGQGVAAEGVEGDGDCAMLDAEGRLVAIGRIDREAGLVRPRVVLRAAEARDGGDA